MTMTAVAIRHVPFEDLGFLEPLLDERGFEIRMIEAPLDDLGDPLIQQADLAVVLGGPIGAYETDAYPFLGPEIEAIAQRLAQTKATLGLCLGCQIMARALGARVYPGGRKEIGWSPVSLTAEGSRSCLAALGTASVLHWHGDTFDLPPGAERLASTDLYENQAFALGRHALALQFHPEVTAAGLEPWYVGHAVEIAATDGVDVPGLRAQAREHAPALETAGRRVFELWIDSAFA